MCHMKAALWREQVLLGDVDAKVLGNDACVLELTLSKRSACEVFATAAKSVKRIRRLMLDSGGGLDLIGLGDLSRGRRDDRAECHAQSEDCKWKDQFSGVEELIEAYVLDSTPSLLSLGKRHGTRVSIHMGALHAPEALRSKWETNHGRVDH